MSGRARAPSTRELAAYLEREVTASEADRIADAVARSPTAQRTLAELERLRGALSTPVRELEGVDLVPGLFLAIDAGVRPPRRRMGRLALPLGVLAAVLAVASLPLLLSGEPVAEFRPKSGTPIATAQRWAGVVAYRVDANGIPKRLTEGFAKSEGLVFSYTNLGPHPFSHLMIFGVDEGGDVHWYHPAYESADSDPGSVPIRQGEASVALAEVIKHDLPAGAFTLHALFTMRPYHVREIEGLLSRGGGGGALASLPDSSEQVIPTRIEP